MAKKEEQKAPGALTRTKEKISEFFLHLVSYGGFNIDEGVIRIWGDLSVFIPMDAYLVIFKELQKTLKEKTNDELFYWLGRLYGKNSTMVLMKRFGISKKDVKEFVNGATQDGFGYMKINYYDVEKAFKGEVTGTNAMFAMEYKKVYGKSKKPVDSYIKGVLGGGAEPLFNMPIHVTEKKCMAMGHKECVYFFEKKDPIPPFNFFKKLKVKEEDVLKKTLSLALRRKSQFKIFKKKKIEFGDGAFILEGVLGVNLPAYGLIALDKFLDELISPKRKTEIYKKAAKAYVESIKSKTAGKDLKTALDVLDIFGFGKFNLSFNSAKRVIVENANDSFSKDYVAIFGKTSEPKEQLQHLILKELVSNSNVKTDVEQNMSITKGQRKNIYTISVLQ